MKLRIGFVILGVIVVSLLALPNKQPTMVVNTLIATAGCDNLECVSRLLSLSRGDVVDGFGVINPKVHSYRIAPGRSNPDFDFRVDGDKLYVFQTNLTRELNESQLVYRTATSEDSYTRESLTRNATKENETVEEYVIDLDRVKRYIEFGEGREAWAIEGSADTFCLTRCETEFEIIADQSGRGINLSFSKEPLQFGLEVLNNRTWDRIGRVNGIYSFNFVNGETYKFKIVIIKNPEDDIEWIVQALGVTLDPTFYGDNRLITVVQDSTGATDFHNGTWSNSWTATAPIPGPSVIGKLIEFTQHPTNEEKLLLFSDSQNDMQSIFWNGSMWDNHLELTASLSSATNFKSFAAAAESISGDYFVPWASSPSGTDENLQYRIWNGTNWTDQAEYTLCPNTAADQLREVSSASSPIDDRILIAFSDEPRNLFTILWDGDAFGNCRIITTNQVSLGLSSHPIVGIDTVWFMDGSKGMVFYGELDGTVTLAVDIYDTATETYSQKNLSVGAFGTNDLRDIRVVSSPFENTLQGTMTLENDLQYIFSINESIDINNLTQINEVGAGYGPYSIDIEIPAKGRFVYGFANETDFGYLNDSYSTSNLILLDGQIGRALKSTFDEDSNMIAFALVDSGLDYHIYQYNLTSGTVAGSLDLQTTITTAFAFEIGVNALPGLPNVNIDIVVPSTASPHDASADLDFTAEVNITIGDQPISTPTPTVNNITVGGVHTVLKSNNVVTDVITMRVNDSGETTSSNPNTVSFASIGHTNYAALATAKLANDVPYSLKIQTKSPTGFGIWTEDDGGANEGINFYFAAVNYSHKVIEDTYHMECGNTSTSSNFFDIVFDTPFPDTNYAVVCNPHDDTDSPICILQDVAGKSTAGFTLFLNDDGGSSEVTSGVEWCAMSYGSYDIGDLSIRAGQDTQASGSFTASFTESIPSGGGSYSPFVMDVTSYTGDGCACSVVSNSDKDGFDAMCWDDANSSSNCNGDSFDWIALTTGTHDAEVNTTVQEQWFEDTVWKYNLTAPAGLSGTQDLVFNLTVGQQLLDTAVNAISYSAGPSTCTYTSGDWNVLASDNCIITINVIMDAASNFFCTGTGRFTVRSSAQITGWVYKFMDSTCQFQSDGVAGFY